MPLAPTFAAAVFTLSELREATMTSAPCFFANSAVARPMPEVPPTTTTFFPDNISIPFAAPNRSITVAQAPHKPDQIDAGKRQRQAEPGDGILQMIVGQVHLQFARQRQAA